MGFGLNLNITGDFLPIVKIDARTGRILRVDRDDGGEQRLVDMTDVFEGVFDLAHAEAGWAYFEDGQAPDFLMEPIGKPLPQRPSKDHRQGVRLRDAVDKGGGRHGARARGHNNGEKRHARPRGAL